MGLGLSKVEDWDSPIDRRIVAYHDGILDPLDGIHDQAELTNLDVNHSLTSREMICLDACSSVASLSTLHTGVKRLHLKEMHHQLSKVVRQAQDTHKVKFNSPNNHMSRPPTHPCHASPSNTSHVLLMNHMPLSCALVLNLLPS